MRFQTQPNGNFAAERPVRHKILWASLVIGLTALAFIGGAAYLVHTSAGDREVHPGPNTSFSKDTGISDAPVPKEAYFLDHSVVNRQNLPTEPNPAPMAIAAYE
jgi:hypothetical protein